MKKRSVIPQILLLALTSNTSLAVQSTQAEIHHSFNISITPALKQIAIDDVMTFGTPLTELRFTLNKNLKIATSEVTPQVKLQCSSNSSGSITQSCSATFKNAVKEYHLQYSGIIFDPIVNDDTSGVISAGGVSLSGNSYWYPQISSIESSPNLTFDMKVTIPSGWIARSQGDLLPQTSSEQQQNQFSFSETHLQDDIYIVANQFTLYSLEQNGKLYEVLLRSKDDALAANFLKLAPKYLEDYSTRIGAYPYTRFSVVENFYETGFGMPSFTLLGPSVIRLPFILYSSFPHEVLHNWWGNSVYVDYATGNWCEGLTTYMADHELQKQQNKDNIYRMTSIVNYMDYAAAGSDFPLRKFVSRQDQSSQAIGYGKSMMFFHMLETQLGSATFQKAIQRFYKRNIFRKAGFDDIQAAFEQESGLDLKPIFNQWLELTGAPKLEITALSKSSVGLKQSQVYDLQVPLVTTYDDKTQSSQLVNMKSIEGNFPLQLSEGKIPVRLEVDPNFDLFRLLDPSEKPSTFSLFYASKNFTYLHEASDRSAKPIFDNWTTAMGVRSSEQIIDSSTILPSAGAVLVSGMGSSVAQILKPLTSEVQDRLVMSNNALNIDGVTYNLTDKVIVLSLKSLVNPKLTVIWVLGPASALTAQLAQRLLHYGNFSALVFDAANSQPTTPILNVYKQIWLPSHSTMKRNF